MKEFVINNKKISVYPCDKADKPIIYLITSEEGITEIKRELNAHGHTDVTLVTVCGIDWNKELTPWESPPVFKNGDPFGGEADRFLRILTKQIIPFVEQGLPFQPSNRGIVGYSLGGLFSVYSLFKTDLFSLMACVSGSLWFPNFKEYVLSHDMYARTKRVYFSLGDKENRTKNPFISCVRDVTAEISRHFGEQDIPTVFEIKNGNHYSNSAERRAEAIMWLLKPSDGE